MTPPQPRALKEGFLDFVFGKRLTPEEQAFARAALPHLGIRRIYAVLLGASTFSVLIVWLGTLGWLPFMETRIDRDWFWPVFGVNVVLRLVWERVTDHYERLARARMSRPL